MTDKKNGRLKFKGKRESSLFGLAVLLAFIFSFPIMGTSFLRLFIFMMILFTALGIFSTVSSSLWNRISFDDKKRGLFRFGLKVLSYDAVRKVLVKEYRGRSAFYINPGVFRTNRILWNVPQGEAERLKEEIHARFPDTAIEEKLIKPSAMMTVMLVVLLAVCIAWAGFTYSVMPGILESIPVTEITEQPGSYRPVSVFEKGPLILHLPDGFKNAKDKDKKTDDRKKEPTENMVVNHIEGITILVDSYKFPGQLGLFSSLFGVNTSYDFYRVGASSKYGIFPALLKTSITDRMTDPVAYEYTSENINAFIVAGKAIEKKEYEALATIAVTDKGTQNSALIFITFLDTPDHDLLGGLVSTLSFKEKEGKEENPSQEKKPDRI